MSDDGVAIVAALESLESQVEALRVCVDYVLFFGLVGLGVMLWRVAVLGKNQRNFW